MGWDQFVHPFARCLRSLLFHTMPHPLVRHLLHSLPSPHTCAYFVPIQDIPKSSAHHLWIFAVVYGCLMLPDGLWASPLPVLWASPRPVVCVFALQVLRPPCEGVLGRFEAESRSQSHAWSRLIRLPFWGAWGGVATSWVYLGVGFVWLHACVPYGLLMPSCSVEHGGDVLQKMGCRG